MSHLLLTLGLGYIGWAVIVLWRRFNAILLEGLILEGHQRSAIAIAHRLLRQIL